METLNEIIVEQQCVKCGNNKCIDKFRQYNSTSHSNTCKKCLNDMDKIKKKIQRQKKIENCLAKCEKCDNEKTLNNFAKLKKFYKKKICLDCYPQFLNNSSYSVHNSLIQ